MVEASVLGAENEMLNMFCFQYSVSLLTEILVGLAYYLLQFIGSCLGQVGQTLWAVALLYESI